MEEKANSLLNNLNDSRVLIDRFCIVKIGLHSAIVLSYMQHLNRKNIDVVQVEDLYEEFCNIFSKRTVIRHVDKLIKIGYLKREKREMSIEYAKSIKEILCNKKLDGCGIGIMSCSWCKINVYILHEHHYPVSKLKGGTLTVSICPNCHAEYHYLVKRLYEKSCVKLTEEGKRYGNIFKEG
jgi:hypothetical protein